MNMTFVIGAISQLLTMCGLESIRMFQPVFIYLLLMKLTIVKPDLPLVSNLFHHLAEQLPSWILSPVSLTVFGLLATAEFVAMRNPDIKEFLVEDLDKYAKPIMSFVLTGAQMMEIEKLFENSSASNVQAASIGGTVIILGAAFAGGYVTWCCCRIRSVVLGVIQTIDPDNNLKLQSLSNYLGEIMLLIIILAVVVLPPLALILTVIGMLFGVYFKRLWARHERRHSHPCAACAAAGKETSVYDCALICPECASKQPDVRQVGWFGFSGDSPLGDMPLEEHAFRLLAAHRCRWCASPLERSHLCTRCGREQWTDEFLAYYVRQTDIRCGLLLSLTIIPFIGTLLALILFRPFAVRPLSVHLSAGGRFLTSLMMTFLKLLLLVVLLILSAVPLLGLLVLLPRYFIVRKKFLLAIKGAKQL